MRRRAKLTCGGSYKLWNDGVLERRVGDEWVEVGATARADGSLLVRVVRDGRCRREALHRLMLEVWGGKWDGRKGVVVWRDGDRSNCAISNLRWKAPRPCGRAGRPPVLVSKSGRKRCAHCQRDLGVEHFSPKAGSASGFSSWCKGCLKQRRAERKGERT